jgi:hypothetical protein
VPEDPRDLLAGLAVRGAPAPKFADLASAPEANAWQPGQKLWLSKYQPVESSPDLDRILALPRRAQLDLDSPRAQALAEMMTRRWSRGERACACATIDPKIAAGKRKCIKHLKPVQAWALYEIGIVGGLLGSVPVGAGKCLDPSTEVFDYSTGRRRRLDELGDLRVATMIDGKLQPAPASAFASGSKACVHVVLCDGSSVTASSDHPILTARGWVHAAQLRDDDFVAVPREMPNPECGVTVSDEIVKFVAYQLSDGGCSQVNMKFTNAAPSVIADWMSSAVALGYDVVETQSRSKAREFRLRTGVRDLSDGRWSVQWSHCRACKHVKHRHLARGLCSSCYQKPNLRDRFDVAALPSDPLRDRWGLHGLAKNKRVHADLWGLPRRQIALFLNRFWACDGHVSAKELEITLASEHMIDDLVFLGLRLGIRSRKRYKRASYIKNGIRHQFDAWRLSLSGADALKFLDEIGPIIGKEQACQRLHDRLSRTKRNSNVDLVPIGETEMHEICDELGFPRRGSGVRGDGSRTRAFRSTGCTRGQRLSREKFRTLCHDFNYTGKYAHLATTEVAWERVHSIKDAGIRQVYDLTVPSTHNFVANGMIVHNTILDLIAPLALEPLGVRRSVLLIPPSLLDQLDRDYRLIREHFQVPSLFIHGPEIRYETDGPMLHVIPYSRLSQPTSSAWIRNLRPDAIIADEVDRLRDVQGAGASRIMRYFAEFGDTRFCGWTGSLTDASLCDYGHLSALALRLQSPLPLDPEVLSSWAKALDEADNPAPPGELGRLCEVDERLDPTSTDDVREGYRRRLTETMGVVVSTQASVDVDLVIEERAAPDIPPIVLEGLHKARACWVRPDTLVGDEYDEELEDAMQVAKVCRELASGIFYRWRFDPIAGVPQKKVDIDEWKEARRDFKRELRRRLADREEWLDSPLLCEHAAQRHWGDRPPRDDRPTWDSSAWPRWRDIKGRVRPTVEACRVSDYLAVDAARWALEHRGIVWYGMVEFGQWVAEISGCPLHGGGPGAGKRLAGEVGNRSIVASIKSHGRGRDGLQALYSEQLIAQIPSSGSMFEQLLGRLHRQGQDAPAVRADYYAHTPEIREALETALARAGYVKGTLGSEQKLLVGCRR